VSGTLRAEALSLATRAVGKTRLTLSTLLRRGFNAFIDPRMQKMELGIEEHIKFVLDEVLQRAGYRRPCSTLFSTLVHNGEEN
jgi:hypothetical protein